MMAFLRKVRALLSEDQRAAATTATAAASTSLHLNVSHRDSVSACLFVKFVLKSASMPTCYLTKVDKLHFVCAVHDISLGLSSALVATADYLSTLSVSSTSLGSDSELTGPDSLLWSSAVELRRGDTKGTLLKVQPL